jgi:hypothetical protein
MRMSEEQAETDVLGSVRAGLESRHTELFTWMVQRIILSDSGPLWR